MKAKLGLAALALMTAAPAAAACTIGQIAEVPVTMTALRPTITAKINGADQRFLVDSGAFFSLISPGAAAALSLPLQPVGNGFHLTGVGGEAEVMMTTVKTFTFAGVPIPRVEFLVGGSEFGSTGLLGQNVLGLADVEYDFPDGMVRLMKTRGCGDANLAYWAKGAAVTMIPIEAKSTADAHTIGTVEINGVKLRAIFDTGAQVTMLSTAAAARAGIKPDGPGVERHGFSSGIGRRPVEAWTIPVASFKIGGEEIRNVRLAMSKMDLGADMLVGADFFISHRIFVSNGNQRMFLTYAGGPVFDRTASYLDLTKGPDAAPEVVKASAPEPTDAAGYSRRGAIAASAHDDKAALADFDHAIALAPQEADYRLQRAMALIRTGERQRARADLDAAIAARPGFVEARLVRSRMALADHDRQAALADLDAAAAAAPRSGDGRLVMAELYHAAGGLAAAVGQYDLWIATHPDDVRRPQALNGRCWTRAMMGEALDRALSDCNSAIGARRSPDFLDSRGLVHLRMEAYDKAIRDYDDALAMSPKLAWSLYGRGLAELRTGQAAKGRADLAAATALRPDLPAEARAHGILVETAAGAPAP